MGSRLPFQKTWKILAWLISTAAAGSLAVTLSPSLGGIHLRNHLFTGRDNNQISTEKGDVYNNSPKTGDTTTFTGNTFNLKIDNSTHYKEGDTIVNQNDNSFTVQIDNLIQEQNNITNILTNIQRQSSTTLNNQTVLNWFFEGSSTESSVLLTPQQSNGSGSFPPSTNLYKSNTNGSFLPSANLYEWLGGFGLNRLLVEKEAIYDHPSGSPAFLSPTAEPLTQNNANIFASSGDNNGSDSIFAFLGSIFSGDQSTVSPNSSSCPGK